MWGKTGLGEFYAKALLDLYGPQKAADSLRALAAAKTPVLDPKAEALIKRLADRLPSECRRHLSYFDGQVQSYGWAFARNRKSVYLGYSEGLFNTAVARGLEQGPPANLEMGEVVVRPMNFGSVSQGTPSWCDGFVVPKGKLAAKSAAIEAFIKMACSDEGYLCWEEPEADFACADLLPAYRATYENARLKKVAPLLPRFRDQLSDNFVINHSVLWNGMHTAGELLEADLTK